MFPNFKLKIASTTLNAYGTLVIGIFALSLMNAVWIVPTFRSIRESASLLALENADRIGSKIEAIIAQNSSAVVAAADELGITPERHEFILKRLLNREHILQSVAFVADTGDIFFRVDRTTAQFQDTNELSSESRAMAERALKGAVGIGDVFISDSLEPRAILSAPIRTAGKIRGALIGEINLRELMESLSKTSLEEGKAYVVDKKGFQILHSELVELLQRPNFLSRPIVQKVLLNRGEADGLSAGDGYVNTNGVSVFAVGRDLAVGGWAIFVEQPRSVAFARERQMFFLAILIEVLGVIAMIYISRNHRLVMRSNIRLKEMLTDLDNSGKMLVRRDLALSRANARLMELDQMKSQFVSTAAHQLRTPLTALKWSLNELLEGDFGILPKEQKELVGDIVAANKRLIRLVNGLLDVARLEEGKSGMNTQKQNIISIVQDVGNQFKKVAEEKNIRFSCENSEKIVLVNFDKDRIDIALTNLIDNAIKYTLPGGAIDLSVTETKKDVRITVIDTGIGIPEEQANRLFSKFFRAHNAMLLETYGSGLGLSVTKDIVEKNQGSITFAHNKGGGSIFTITLPKA